MQANLGAKNHAAVMPGKRKKRKEKKRKEKKRKEKKRKEKKRRENERERKGKITGRKRENRILE